jgi:hypothetical protein
MRSMIEQFRDFAASKPADEAYNYEDMHGCAIAQFREHLGITSCLWARNWRDMDFDFAFPRPWTFSALATRLNKALAK